MLFRQLGLFGAVLILSALSLGAQEVTHIAIAGRDVAIWTPAGPAPKAGYPVILFSHGFAGCNTQSAFLKEALARAGYLVLAPNHLDAQCPGARPQTRVPPGKARNWKPQASFLAADIWSDAVYRDRAEDIGVILDAITRSATFQGIRVDAGRIGLAGHSLGGYTALGMAGAWPS